MIPAVEAVLGVRESLGGPPAAPARRIGRGEPGTWPQSRLLAVSRRFLQPVVVRPALAMSPIVVARSAGAVARLVAAVPGTVITVELGALIPEMTIPFTVKTLSISRYFALW